MKKNILLIGGLNSVGVPYTRDNKNRISHFSVVEDFLNSKFDVIEIDMYSMSKYNTTEYLNSIIDNNLDLKSIRNNQRASIEICRKKGFFQFLQLPHKTISLYPKLESDKGIIIKTEIKKHTTIFLYSCGANDFLENVNSDLGKMLNPKNMEKSFSKIDKEISNVIEKIKLNLENLINLNKEIEIYILGVYLPTTIKYVRKKVKQPIEKFNNELKKLSILYKNVFYVDNSNLSTKEMAKIDWHPNAKGQLMIGENIISVIKKNSKNIKK